MQWSQNVGCGMIPDDISLPGVLHSYRSSQGASVGIIISISININICSIRTNNLKIKGIVSIISIRINIFSISIIII